MHLHNYQKQALSFLLKNPRCALFMEMGLGKTLVTLLALHFLTKSNKASKTLLIAPLRVCNNTWPREIEKWRDSLQLTIRHELITGNAKKRKQALESSAELHIINKENVEWLIQEASQNPGGTLGCRKSGKIGRDEWPYDVLVIDESSCFKDPKSKRFKALKAISHLFSRVILLSGTPIGNSLMDIWSQVFLLDGGERLMKSFYSYRDYYFKSDYSGFQWTALPHAADIPDKIADICLTIKSAGNIDLPDMIMHNVYCQLPDDLRLQYEELEKNFMLCLSETIYAPNAAVMYNKLLQFCSGCVYHSIDSDVPVTYEHIHSLKLDALEDILEFNQGKNILLSFLYKFEKEKIKEKFKYAVSIDEPDAIARWNKGEVRLLLAHPKSAGHGLNLQEGGNTVVWFSMPWSLELYSQFNARLHRQGQSEKVFIHHIVMQNTIDELVQERLEHKKLGLEAFLERLKLKYNQGDK